MLLLLCCNSGSIYGYFLEYVFIFFFPHRHAFLFWLRVVSRALGCGARRGPACTLGARLGPGRGPWRVIWASKVAGPGSFSRDRVPHRRAVQDQRNPTISAIRSAAAAAVSHRPSSSQALYFCGKPRYNSSRTSSSCRCDGRRRCSSVRVFTAP